MILKRRCSHTLLAASKSEPLSADKSIVVFGHRPFDGALQDFLERNVTTISLPPDSNPIEDDFSFGTRPWVVSLFFFADTLRCYSQGLASI